MSETPNSWTTEEPTVLRDGKPILQQRWAVKHFEDGSPTGVVGEWRDVTLEDESDLCHAKSSASG